MAHTITHIPETGLRAGLAGVFRSIGRGMVAYMERRSRADEIARLEAMSDAQLAQLGISRNTIPAYVFRDLFYI